jgi:hypothetical protein
MLRQPIPLACTFVVSLSLSAAAAAQTPQTLPAWMAGSWCATQGAERIEEVWLAPAGGFMLGMSRTVAPNQKQPQFEFLRVELRDGLATYLAQPQGRAAVAFVLTQASDTSARFENPAHDFPQRIEYRRNGNALHAEIAGPRKGGKELVIGFDYVLCAGEARKG